MAMLVPRGSATGGAGAAGFPALVASGRGRPVLHRFADGLPRGGGMGSGAGAWARFATERANVEGSCGKCCESQWRNIGMRMRMRMFVYIYIIYICVCVCLYDII